MKPSSFTRALFAAVSVAALSGLAVAQTATTPEAPPTAAGPAMSAESSAPKPTADMQAVLDKLASLGGKPIETLSADDARKQPSPADAVMKIMEDKGIKKDDTIEASDRTYVGGDGSKISARFYRPEGSKGPMPIILYIHGGGWVIADLDTYDATPRALSKMTGALVISVDYRHAPEHKFPAAHDDINAAYQWVFKEAPDWGGDTKKVAVVGESAGGNMAVDLAIAARDNKWQAPTAVVAVYPVAAKEKTPSKEKFVDTKPLNAPMLDWFFKNTLASPDQASDKRLDLVNADLKGLPPTTIVVAEIDPLHDDGVMLAKKMKAAGDTVDLKEYKGVTHEFFGMGTVVAEAKDAEQYVADALKSSFGKAAE